MKQINDLIQVAQKPVIHENNFEQKETVKKEVAKATNELFTDLCVIFPSFLATIKKSSPEDAKRLFNKTKKMWLDEMLEEKLTPQMVETGLKKCRKSSTGFMPTVGEFVSWCKPSDDELGIPSLRAAYLEACNYKSGDKWSHNIVFQCYKHSDPTIIKSMPEIHAMPIFKANYEVLKKRLISGDDLSEGVLIMLEAPKKPAHDAERVRKSSAYEQFKNSHKQILED